MQSQIEMIIEDTIDPEELERWNAQGERFKRNQAWLAANASEVFTRYRGKRICVAGEELFVADTAEEALALARAAHPEDDAPLLRVIPRSKNPRIYAY